MSRSFGMLETAYASDPAYCGLMEQIARDPDDPTPRGVLRDWLLDQGREDRAAAMASAVPVGLRCERAGTRWFAATSAAPVAVQRGSLEAVSAHLSAVAMDEEVSLVVRRGLVEAVRVPNWQTWRLLGRFLVRHMPLAVAQIQCVSPASSDAAFGRDYWQGRGRMLYRQREGQGLLPFEIPWRVFDAIPMPPEDLGGYKIKRFGDEALALAHLSVALINVERDAEEWPRYEPPLGIAEELQCYFQ